MLKITQGNRKMKELSRILLSTVGVFDLPAGKTCPAADICKSSTEIIDGKIRVVDGENCKFRCYAASGEVYPSVRKMRYSNYEQLLDASTEERMFNLMYDAVQLSGCRYIRLHSSGDFFSRTYWNAWISIAKVFSNRIFYGYTKRVDLLTTTQNIPENFRFNVSEGGKFDHLIDYDAMAVTRVIIHRDEGLGWNILTGALTENAVINGESFCIPVHGTQPAGSVAGKMVRVWKKIMEAKH